MYQDQWWNNEKCRRECKKIHIREKNYVSNHTTCNYENRKYLASIMDDSAIICDEVIDAYEEWKTIATTFNKKKVRCKT